MSVSKRTRFEVLKRDGHKCRYCGDGAPDVKLTVDHVIPVSLGGSDAPDNLVAACVDCNSGKASTSPNDELVQQVGEDELRWAEAVKAAAQRMLEETEARSTRNEWFLAHWRRWDDDCTWLPNRWSSSIDSWLGSGLPQEVLIECLEIALANRGVDHDRVFAYMGGVARSKIGLLHDAARAILDEETADGT